MNILNRKVQSEWILDKEFQDQELLPNNTNAKCILRELIDNNLSLIHQTSCAEPPKKCSQIEDFTNLCMYVYSYSIFIKYQAVPKQIII